MATGKELVRMITCGIWKEFIEKRKDYCSVQIFNDKGKSISLKEAKKGISCHAKILFKKCPEDSLNLIAEFLRNIASTRCESMCKNTFEYYGFQEVIIS